MPVNENAGCIAPKMAEPNPPIRACSDCGLDDWRRISVGKDDPMRIVLDVLAGALR